MVVCLFMATTSSLFAQNATNRPACWACSMTLTGVPNFYQVTTNLYRGAQPTADGMKQLQTLGVRSVFSLRVLRSDRHELRGTELKHYSLPTVPWHVGMDDVVTFLKATTDTNNLPMFVHCERGADRTGFMCAMYRIVVCDWTKDEAIREMEQGGYHFSPVWHSLIKEIQKADVAALKNRVGLPVVNAVIADKN